MPMEGEEQLRRLETWIRSPEFPALVGAYQTYHEAGTLGGSPGAQAKQRPAVINERGILYPHRFTEYMGELQTRVLTTLRGAGSMYSNSSDLTVQLLQETLQDMFGSDNLGNGTFENTGLPLKQLFARGHEMGGVLADYAKVAGPRKPKSGVGNPPRNRTGGAER